MMTGRTVENEKLEIANVGSQARKAVLSSRDPLRRVSEETEKSQSVEKSKSKLSSNKLNKMIKSQNPLQESQFKSEFSIMPERNDFGTSVFVDRPRPETSAV